MRSHSYIRSAITILQGYEGKEPFAPYIKQFFKSDKKFGSRDRKEISHLCYCYFRLGGAAKNLSMEDRILLGVFLSSTASQIVLRELKPEWEELVTLPLSEKLPLAGVPGIVHDLFPFSAALSQKIDAAAFSTAHLVQPLLYLRLRPHFELAVCNRLTREGIPYEKIGEDCIALANSTKIDELVKLNREAVVQDLSSQRVMDLLLQQREGKIRKVWDCCAASGGKSILAYDKLPQVMITVSDVRSSIIHNLKNRFRDGGINHYYSFVADVSAPGYFYDEHFDLVICDVPCSGSGTWGRTPEQLVTFTENKIEHYASLQKSIVLNASKSVGKGGYLLYATCSVFEKENEEAVAYIQANTHLELVGAQYHKGYDRKADTLFSALFRS